MARLPRRVLELLASRRAAQVAVVSSFVLAAFVVRAASLDTQSLWRDEVDALRFATAPWSEMLSNFTRPGWNGPLYFVLLRAWIALTGRSEYAMRFLSLIFGVISVPLVYALGRRLLTRSVGLIAALLVTVSPYFVWYSQETKMYTLVPALALLAIYSLHRAVHGEGKRWWAVQILATTLAFYSHILAALLIPVQALLYFAWWPRARRQWPGAIVSLACLTLPYLPLAAWQAPMALRARETGFHQYSLPQMAEILLNGWSAGVLGRGLPWGASLMGVLATLGLVAPLTPLLRPSPSLCAQREGEGLGGSRTALLIWLVTPVLLVWLVSLRQPLFTDRYLVWSAPAFYLLAAAGLASIAAARGWIRWAVVPLMGAILAFSGANLWQQATVPVKSDFRAAAAYVADYQEPRETTRDQTAPGTSRFTCYLPLISADFDDLIIFQIPYGRYTFDYYFPIDEYPWDEGLYTNHRAPDGSYRMSEREAAWRMAEMTKGYRVIWLVATEMPMWDERRLVKKWLDENAERVAEGHFVRVDVYRYVK